MDQSRLDGRSGPLVGRTAIRFEPPRLTSVGGGRISRSTAEVGALAEARAQGRAEAMAELSASIDSHRRATDDLTAAAGALSAALGDIARTDMNRVRDLEQQVLQLAVALAEEIIGREVRDDDSLVVAAATRALAFTPDRVPVVLRVHPDDLATVRDAVAGGAAAHLTMPVQVVADPTIGRAGAVAEAGPLRIDAQIDAALARIRDAFAS